MAQRTLAAESIARPVASPLVGPETRRVERALSRFARDRAAVLGASLTAFFLLVALLGPLVMTVDPIKQNLIRSLDPPTWFGPGPFGHDELGRDIFSRVVHGARISIAIAASSVSLAFLVGLSVGIVSGYLAGAVDNVVMRLLDVLLAFPGFLLAVALASVLGPGLENVIIAVTIYSIPTFARLARGTTLSVKQREYVEAARALGAGPARIMVRHVLPNSVGPCIVQASLRLGTVVLTAAGLSFIGLGVQPPTPEWGKMLADGRQYLQVAPHVVLFPGFAISLLVLGFNLLGDGLRDALDPRLK